jgi:putative heme-binding domain-containing protein
LLLAQADVIVSESCVVEFMGCTSTGVCLDINGRRVYRRDGARPFVPDSESFDTELGKGRNRIVVTLSAVGRGVQFHWRFRRKSSAAEHERLTQTALKRAGDSRRGRELFFNAAKTQCVKCHRVGEQGERIGPDLTGVGSRFPRIYLIESVLQPSRSITPGYQTFLVSLKSGRVVTGVKITETDNSLTLGDNKGDKLVLRKTEIEEQRPHPLSLMPEGLEKQLTGDEFVDLIAFLVSLKDTR